MLGGIRKMDKKLILALILISLLFFAIGALATDMEFLNYWKKDSEIIIKDYEKLLKKGYGKTYNLLEEDGGIKITLESAISDELNTLLLFKIENKSNISKYKDDRFSIGQRQDREGLVLSGDILKYEKNKFMEIRNLDQLTDTHMKWIMDDSIKNIQSLYSEEEGASKVLLKLSPMEDEKGSIILDIGSLRKINTRSQSGREFLDGRWSFEIEVEREKTREYVLNKEYEIDRGIKFLVDKIRMTPTGTKVDYRYEYKNKDEKIHVEGLEFYLSRFFKKYKVSNITVAGRGGRPTVENLSKNFVKESVIFDQMYDKNPRFLNVNFDKIYYRSGGREKYKLDWNKLPLELSYEGSKIHIKSLEEKEDEISISVEEDRDKNREYSLTNLDIYLDNNFQVWKEIEGKKYYYKDRKGRIYDEYEAEDMDYSGLLSYVSEFDIVIGKLGGNMEYDHYEEDNDFEDGMGSYHIEDLIIDGQYFEKFLNEKIRLKLR